MYSKENSGSDSDCVSFLCANVSFLGGGFWYSQLELLQAVFGGHVRLPFLVHHFFPALTALTAKKGSATPSTSNLKLGCGRARIGENMQKVPVRLVSNR